MAALAAGASLAAFPAGVAAQIGPQVRSFPSLAALRAGGADPASAEVALVESYWPGAGLGGGFFHYDAADVSSADDGGTVIVAGAARWKRVFSGALDVTWFGATGGGEAERDESPYFQAAMDAAFARRGGEVEVPASRGFYNFRNAVVCRDGVSLRGVGGKPRLRNTNRTLAQRVGLPGTIFLPGNFHPNFTQDRAAHAGVGARYYPTGPIADGAREVRLARPGDAARFLAGDKVYVASRTSISSGGFGVFDYAWLSTCAGADTASGVVRFEDPVDHALAAGLICRLADNPGRGGLPLFFWRDGGLFNLDLGNAGLPLPYVGVVSDQACQRCRFDDLTVRGSACGVINSQQDCHWARPTMIWSLSCLEMAQNSLRTRVEAPTMVFESAPGVEPQGLLMVHERSRWCAVDDAMMELGGVVVGPKDGQLMAIAGAAHCRILRPRASGAGWNGPIVYLGGPSTPSFAVEGNVIAFADIRLDRCLVWASLDGGGTAATAHNGIEFCLFEGTPSDPAEAMIAKDNVGPNFLRGNVFDTGGFVARGPNTGLSSEGEDHRLAKTARD
ncbi:MAG: hypothetical protein ACREEQ_13280 [Caulobacteraceae bacterium]